MSTSRDVKIIVHGIVASVGMLLLTPLAILIARYLRGHKWLPSHQWINVSSAVLVVVGAALGAWVGDGDGRGQGSMSWWTHKGVGVVIAALAVIQVLLGWWAHKTKGNERQAADYAGPKQPFESARNKSIFRKLHMVLGILFIFLGDGQVYSGLTLWPVQSSKQTPLPSAVRVVYWIFVAGFAALYIIGWAFEAKGRRGRVAAPKDDHVPLSQPADQQPSFPYQFQNDSQGTNLEHKYTQPQYQPYGQYDARPQYPSHGAQAGY